MLEVGLVGHKNAKSILFKVCKPMVYGRVKHSSTFQPTFNYAPIGPISLVFRALSLYLSNVRNEVRGIDRPMPQMCWATKPAAVSPKLLTLFLPPSPTPPSPPTKSASTEHTGYVRGHRELVVLGLRSCWPWRLMPR